jgi:hypothetical protein
MTDQQRQEPEIDELAKMVHADMLADTKRLKELQSVNPELLHKEMVSTVMYYLRKLGEQTLGVRNWMYQCVQGLGDHITEVEALAGGSSDGETQLTEEDAEKILKLATAARTLCDELLKTQQTEDGKQKLEEIKQLADECESMASDNVLVEDDEDDENDDVVVDDSSEEVH